MHIIYKSKHNYMIEYCMEVQLWPAQSRAGFKVWYNISFIYNNILVNLVFELTKPMNILSLL